MSRASQSVFDAIAKARRESEAAAVMPPARSTDEIIAALRGIGAEYEGAPGPWDLCDAAADRLATLQSLLRLTAPAAIRDELLELRLLAIEGRAREAEVVADALWLQGRLAGGTR